MRIGSALAVAGAYCVGLAFGQQYVGEVIPNSLPTVPGSEITYFKITDPSGKNKNLTLINYYSHGVDTSKRINESQIQRAVVFIHGLNRDPGTYMSNMLSALSQVTSDPNVNFNTVSIMAPYFPNGDDKNYGYPFNSGQAAGRGSNTSCMVWPASEWVSGGNTEYPYYSYPGISSYTVLDQIIQYYDNATLFPNLHQIVIAGHSAGAQTVQRYVAIGSALNTKIRITYYIANPDSYAWFNTTRPFPYLAASCSIYDVYREGYTNFTEYPMTYGVDLVAQGRPAILSNYNSRGINYARGTLDLGDDSSTCAPFTTGKDRNERFFEFIKAFPPSCSAPTATNCDTVDFVPVGHDAAGMMAAPAGLARLFLDNFYGNGNKSYDFGYPREQIGDDPYPNPALDGTPIPTNTNTYAGNMTYYGCWTDQSPATFTNLTYSGTQNTIELCTSTCASGGNTIAGLEGNECFCGKALGYQATQVVGSSCDTECPGSNETCGGYTRLSIFSNGQPEVLTPPTTPATVAGFNYLDCYTEATSGRALSSKSTSTSLMTLEYCASFCQGYEYFGTEYADECYCGNAFAAGANVTSAAGCSYICANNAEEFCGGSDRLTVYQNSNPVAVSSSTGASATSSAATGTSTGTVSCPASNGTTYVSNGKNFTIECGIDHQAGDLTSLQVSSFQACIDACAQNSQCVDVSLSGSACYLKSTLGAAIDNAGVYGARLITSSTPATTTAGSTATSSSAAASATGTTSTVSCPASNGQTYVSNGEPFVIECGVDRVGGDLESVQVTTFQQCIDACANTTGCVDVSLSGTACYLKNSLTAATTNSGIDGARLATASTSSSSSSSAPASTSTSTPVSCPASNSTTVVSNGVSFLIECGIDHQGGDMSSLQVNSLQQCIDTCATTTGCVDLSLSGSACYLKSTVGAAVYNGVYGARVVNGTSSSTGTAT